MNIVFTHKDNITSYDINGNKGSFAQSDNVYEDDLEEVADIVMMLPYEEKLKIQRMLDNKEAIYINGKQIDTLKFDNLINLI